ncbi:hypothetical protein J6590_000415 [Homalodisca vitripennis]|nr:hypothetical protein J6590_000415 [Homalodisca vitripennis]
MTNVAATWMDDSFGDGSEDPLNLKWATVPLPPSPRLVRYRLVTSRCGSPDLDHTSTDEQRQLFRQPATVWCGCELTRKYPQGQHKLSTMTGQQPIHEVSAKSVRWIRGKFRPFNDLQHPRRVLQKRKFCAVLDVEILHEIIALSVILTFPDIDDFLLSPYSAIQASKGETTLKP